MAYSLSRNERIYLQTEASFGVIPNSTGTATVAGGDACRHTKCVLTPEAAKLKRPDKTGSRSQTAGARGRKAGRWSLEMALAGNGAAGVLPDCDPLLVALFGKAGTVAASTSVTYSLDDAIKSFCLWRFRTPATVMQQVAAGCVVNEATFNLGQDVASWSLSGGCVWVPDSVNFSSLDTAGKCGLTAFPSEPASPVVNGSMIAGFTGALTVGGGSVALRSLTLKIGTGNDIVRDTFGSYYGDSAEGDERAVSVSLDLYDSDAAGTTALYAAAEAGTPVDIVAQIGTVTGNKWTFTIKGVELVAPALSDGQRRWSASFGDSLAHGSSISALDEVGLVIS
jgi:hypothetical protein